MNITSLPKHLEELKIFLQQIPFEILSLNETRLDDTIENNTVRIPGYNIIRRDRNRRGGGVAILVKNNYSYIVRNDLLTNDLEAICIELTLRVSRPILILNWYRPPDSEAQVFDWFEEFLQKAEAENKELIILGDLNCDLYASMPNSNTRKMPSSSTNGSTGIRNSCFLGLSCVFGCGFSRYHRHRTYVATVFPVETFALVRPLR